MKKVFLSVAAFILFGATQAQDVKFGVKAGLNVSDFMGDVNGNSSRIGFHVGGLAEIKISEKFALQPELLYSDQGTKFDDGTIDLGYLNVPVMVKYFVAEKFSLEAGPQVGFLVSAKANPDTGSSVDIKDSYNTIDFGILAGASYDFTENIFAGLRYNLGLSNIEKDSGDDKVQNSNLSLSVGYKF